MDLIEFSIACKLISLKLRNVEVPKMLPPTLIASLKHIGTPIRTPTGSMSPTEGYKQFLTQQTPPIQQPPVSAQQYQQPMMMNQVQPMPQAIPQQISPEMLAHQQQQMIAQQAAMIQQQQAMMQPQMMQPQMMQPQMVPMAAVPTMPVAAMPYQPPMMTNSIPNIMPQVVAQPKPSLIEQLSSGSLLDSFAQQPPVVSTGPLPAAPTPTPPQSGHASRSMSFSEKAPSVPESPTAEWAVPQSSKLKFTQLFNATDKTRSGFLTGTQARGILLQTKVPNPILAQIWSLSGT